jgi:drug/metabolite transporter (DMT)-like permease
MRGCLFKRTPPGAKLLLASRNLSYITFHIKSTSIIPLNLPLILSLFAGFFFGLWPVVARFAGISSFWIAFLIPLGTLLVVSFEAAPKIAATTWPVYKILAIGIIAGAINGFGMLAYGRILSNGSLNVSKYVPIVAVISIATAAVGAFVAFKEPVTLQKSLGLLFAVAAVWLLS